MGDAWCGRKRKLKDEELPPVRHSGLEKRHGCSRELMSILSSGDDETKPVMVQRSSGRSWGAGKRRPTLLRNLGREERGIKSGPRGS